MRRFITERNLVVVLFVMVVITFSFAERDTKKIEHLYIEAPPLYSPDPLADLKVKPVTQNVNVPVKVK